MDSDTDFTDKKRPNHESVLRQFAGRIWWFCFWASAGVLLYILSAGPALALAQRGYLSKSAVRSVYRPVAWIEVHLCW